MFIDAFRSLAAHPPAQPAVIADGAELSWPALWSEVEALAGWLHRQGVGPGQTVGLTVRGELAHLRASLALIRLGCVHVILPSYESDEYRRTLAGRARVQRHVTERVELAPRDLPHVVLPRQVPEAPGPDRLPEPDPDAPCVYFVSSGTTGRPKLIPLGQGQLFEQALNWQYPPGREVFWRPTPIEYNNSKRQRLYNVVNGSVNVFADPAGHTLVELVERYGVTRLNLSVVQARRLMHELQGAGRRLPESCQLRIGGSAVSPDLRQALQATVTPHLHVGYATSEFGAISTAGPGHHREPGNAGRIHPGVELEIVDEAGRPLPAGETGRIRARGPGMATAYFGDDEASARAFRDGWFHPGDMGRIDCDGLLQVIGRADDMMSLASINIFPSEIEAAFAGYPGLVECAAFALKSRHFGDVPVLAVVGDPAIDLSEMQRFGRGRLGIRAPRKVLRVESLPRNSGGKLDLQQLRDWVEQGPKE